MSDPDHDLFGLMKLAERNQDAVGKASKHAVAVSAAAATVLKEAAGQHQESVNTLTKTASAAIAQAVHDQAKEMAQPLRQAAQEATKSAQEAFREFRAINAWVFAAVFAVGVLAGFGGAVLYQRDQAKSVVPISEVIDYLEKSMAKPK